MIQSPLIYGFNGPRMDPEQPRSIVFAAVGVVGSRRPLQLEARQGCSKEKQVASSSFQGDPRRDKWEESPLSTVLLRSMIVRQKPSERPAPEDDTC